MSNQNYFNGPEYSDKDLGFDDGFDVFGEPTNAQTMQQLEKEDIDNNIRRNDSMNQNSNGITFSIKRTVGHNKSFFGSIEINDIPTVEEYQQWAQWADMEAKRTHKTLQEDYPAQQKYTQKKFDNGVKHNVPTNNYSNNNYNNAPQQNKQFPDMIPCQCGSNMVLSKYPNGNPKTTKDKSRAEYKCNCGKFKWQ